MPWTKEQKRAHRASQRAAAANKRKADVAALAAVAPPNSALKKPPAPKDIGNNLKDYGGHYKGLNFPLEKGTFSEVRISKDSFLEPMHGSGSDGFVLKKMGDLCIGLCYDGDWKAKSRLAGKGKRKYCLDSEKWLDFLFEVKRQLHPLLHSTLQPLIDETMRLTVLCGAMTLGHTDSFRGNTPNALYICWTAGEPLGWLTYDLFPRFKASVVIIDGKFYIPHSFSEASDELRCIGENPKKPGFPIYYLFPSSYLDKCLPYGDLPYCVVGWLVSGEIQVVHDYGETAMYQKPLTFQTYTWEYILRDAKDNRATKPRNRLVKLNKVNEWMLFDAYRYRHWWSGNNMITRYHAFFRSIRQTPTSSNIIRKGDRMNFINMKP